MSFSNITQQKVYQSLTGKETPTQIGGYNIYNL